MWVTSGFFSGSTGVTHFNYKPGSHTVMDDNYNTGPRSYHLARKALKVKINKSVKEVLPIKLNLHLFVVLNIFLYITITKVSSHTGEIEDSYITAHSRISLLFINTRHIGFP